MGEPKPESKTDPAVEHSGLPGSSDSSREPDTAPPEAAAPSQELTPEEQMALYEKDLKESDWGHQPC